MKRALVMILGLAGLVMAEALDVEVWLDKGNGAVYRQNESVAVYFKTNKDCFVTVYGIDTEGYLHLLYPLSKARNNFVRGGKTYSIPDDWDYPDLKAGGPEGIVYIQALATTENQNIPDWPVYSRYFQDSQYRVLEDPYEAFQRLGNEISMIEPDPEFFDSKGVYYYVHEKVPYPRYMCFQCHPHRPVSPYVDVCPTFSIVIYDRWYLPPRYVYWDWYHTYYRDYYYGGYWFVFDHHHDHHHYYGAKSYKSYPNLMIAPKHSAEKNLSFRKEYKPIYSSYQKSSPGTGKSYKSESGVTTQSKSGGTLGKSYKSESGVVTQSKTGSGVSKTTTPSTSTGSVRKVDKVTQDPIQPNSKNQPSTSSSGSHSPRFKPKSQNQSSISPQSPESQSGNSPSTVTPKSKNGSSRWNEINNRKNQPSIRSGSERSKESTTPSTPTYRRPSSSNYRINRSAIQSGNPSSSDYRQYDRLSRPSSSSNYSRPSPSSGYSAPSTSSRPSSPSYSSPSSSSRPSSAPRVSAPSSTPSRSSSPSPSPSSGPSKKSK
ncbi:MAG: DUF4384 domain-containing protein [Candidatus Delongbacteria bacterium]|nr:DUF4384 domain-containing protein [Candidatus Delongbacteria bacterium]